MRITVALGTTPILATSLSFALSSAISGVVHALPVPVVAPAHVHVHVHVHAHAVARHALEPRRPRSGPLPAEVVLP